jgi:hypothetical protein
MSKANQVPKPLEFQIAKHMDVITKRLNILPPVDDDIAPEKHVVP